MYEKVFEIVKEEADSFGVPAAKILGKGRRRTLVTARRAAIIRCRKETTLSLSELGQVFGNRDHATILHYLPIEP